MISALSEKSDDQIQNLIENHERRKLFHDSLYLEALAERGRRKKTGLNFEKSKRIILEAARDRRFLSYKELAEGSGAQWSKVRYKINNHLGDLVRFAHGKGWPMLSAIVVNQANITTGEMEESTLKGFIKTAHWIGRDDVGSDERAFLKREQERVFDFARELPES